MTVEVETRMNHPAAGEQNGSPVTPELGRMRKDSPQRPQRSRAAPGSWTLRLPKCEGVSSCCFKPLSLWYFVIVAPGHLY